MHFALAIALAIIGVAVTAGTDFNGSGPPGIVVPDDGGSGGPSWH